MTRHRARRPDSSLTTTVSPPFSSETTVWLASQPYSGLLLAPKKRAYQGGQSLVSVFAAHQEQLSTGDLLDITSASGTLDSGNSGPRRQRNAAFSLHRLNPPATIFSECSLKACIVARQSLTDKAGQGMEVTWWQVFLACAGLVVSICSLLGGLILWQSNRLAKQIQAFETGIRSEIRASATRIVEQFRSFGEGNGTEPGELRSAVSTLTENAGELRGPAKSRSSTDERP